MFPQEAFPSAVFDIVVAALAGNIEKAHVYTRILILQCEETGRGRDAQLLREILSGELQQIIGPAISTERPP